MMRKTVLLLFAATTIYLASVGTVRPQTQEDGYKSNRGVWVTVFSKNKVLYSGEAVKRLIEFCKAARINQIYLQVYQSGRAYYDSRICDRQKYEGMVKEAGRDTIDLLLGEARKNNIKVFAWVNVLSLGKNSKANLILQFGDSVLTRDQHLRTSVRDEAGELDRYYLRENQFFLEPGDLRVKRYIVSVIGEILERYPLFSGIHLDYIRYPSTVPSIPGSRFSDFGLTYGYGEENIGRFRERTGLDPLTGLDSEEKHLLWDNWKRQQVTALVEAVSAQVKARSPELLLSCAVIPSAERAYDSLFQDWSLWLEGGIIDYAVLMNYSRDQQLNKERVKSSLGQRGKGKVFIGLGVFLLKDNPRAFLEQYQTVVGF